MSQRPTAPLPTRRWLNQQELASYAGVNEATIRYWQKDRGLPVHRLGKVVRYDVVEFDQWFIRRTSEPAE